MRYVKQKHKNGCAIASLAMILGVGYSQIFKIARPKKNFGKKYTGTPMDLAVKILNKYDCKYRIFFKRTGLKKLHRLKSNAYISINTPKGGRHAIVWDEENQRVLDPDRKVPYRRDYINKHMNFIIEIIE